MEKYLDYNDFKNMVASLAHSQGFYGRLYEQLIEMENCDDKTYLNDFKKEIRNIKATNELDFIFWLES